MGNLCNQRLANNRDLRLTDEEVFNLTLIQIKKHLQKNRKSLKDYPGMPYPNGYVAERLGNRFIYEERAYNHNEQLQEFNGLYRSLTDEQRGVFKKIMEVVNNRKRCVFFLNSHGGTGKTYMWRTLSYIRSQ